VEPRKENLCNSKVDLMDYVRNSLLYGMLLFFSSTWICPRFRRIYR